MKIRFRINVGSTDVNALNKKFNTSIKFKDCTEGSEVEIPDDVAQVLIKREHAEEVKSPDEIRSVSKPAAIKGVKEETK
jgi:hypothetical protein